MKQNKDKLRFSFRYALENEATFNKIINAQKLFQQSNYFVTSVKENTNSISSISVFPNPANGFINICSESIEIKKMKMDLLDIAGKIIHSENFQNNLQLSLMEYTSSVCFIRVYDEDNNSIQTFKLLKTN